MSFFSDLPLPLVPFPYARKILPHPAPFFLRYTSIHHKVERYWRFSSSHFSSYSLCIPVYTKLRRKKDPIDELNLIVPLLRMRKESFSPPLYSPTLHIHHYSPLFRYTSIRSLYHKGSTAQEGSWRYRVPLGIWWRRCSIFTQVWPLLLLSSPHLLLRLFFPLLPNPPSFLISFSWYLLLPLINFIIHL